MRRLARFARSVPVAFWLALVGVALSLGAFFSSAVGTEGELALILMLAGFAAVAVLSAFDRPAWRAAAAAVAGLIALIFAFLLITFAASPALLAGPLVAHFCGLLLAGGAAVSDLVAVRRSSLQWPRPRPWLMTLGLVLGGALGFALGLAILMNPVLAVLVGAGAVLFLAVMIARARFSGGLHGGNSS